jgi:accessory colonization factor AcfC
MMKKFVAILSLLALAISPVASASAQVSGGAGTQTATTSLTQPTTTGTTSPIVIKTKWEMRQFRTGDVIAANSLSTGNQVGWWNAGSTSLLTFV